MASYVALEFREKFETLSINLKDYILERNVQINDIYTAINHCIGICYKRLILICSTKTHEFTCF